MYVHWTSLYSACTHAKLREIDNEEGTIQLIWPAQCKTRQKTRFNSGMWRGPSDIISIPIPEFVLAVYMPPPPPPSSSSSLSLPLLFRSTPFHSVPFHSVPYNRYYCYCSSIVSYIIFNPCWHNERIHEGSANALL